MKTTGLRLENPGAKCLDENLGLGSFSRMELSVHFYTNTRSTLRSTIHFIPLAFRTSHIDHLSFSHQLAQRLDPWAFLATLEPTKNLDG